MLVVIEWQLWTQNNTNVSSLQKSLENQSQAFNSVLAGTCTHNVNFLTFKQTRLHLRDLINDNVSWAVFNATKIRRIAAKNQTNYPIFPKTN